MSFKKKEISDDVPALADDSDDTVAAPVASDSSGGGPTISKRTFLKGATVGAGSLAVGGVGLNYSTRDAKAIAPAVIVGAGFAAGFAGRWALDEWQSYTDSPPDGLSPSALEEETRKALLRRKSRSESTFIDNQNILQGIPNNAYSEAKIAAIESLNNGDSQSTVESNAKDAIDNYEATVLKNILKSWNSVVLIHGQYGDATASSSLENKFQYATDETSDWEVHTATAVQDVHTVTLPDDSTFSVHSLDYGSAGSASDIDPPTADNFSKSYKFAYGSTAVESFGTDNPDRILYFELDKWGDLVSSVKTEFQNVRDGILLWVDEVYPDYQQGDLDSSELLSPRDRANMLADSGNVSNQAAADLISLNQPVNLDNQVTINIPSVGATLTGTLAVSDESVTFQSGNTYDPQTDINGDVWFSYDVLAGNGTWTDYETPINSGVVTFTSEPYTEAEYSISTTDGESVTVSPSNFTDQGDGTFTVDLSTELETTVSEVDSVSYSAPDDAAEYETIRLTDTFEILKITSSDGSEKTDVTFQRPTEPHTDSNYITQEQWDQQQKAMDELISDYDSSSGGGGISLDQFSIGSIPGAGVVAIFVGGLLVLFGQDDN